MELLQDLVLDVQVVRVVVLKKEVFLQELLILLRDQVPEDKVILEDLDMMRYKTVHLVVVEVVPVVRVQILQELLLIKIMLVLEESDFNYQFLVRQHIMPVVVAEETIKEIHLQQVD